MSGGESNAEIDALMALGELAQAASYVSCLRFCHYFLLFAWILSQCHCNLQRRRNSGSSRSPESRKPCSYRYSGEGTAKVDPVLQM